MLLSGPHVYVRTEHVDIYPHLLSLILLHPYVTVQVFKQAGAELSRQEISACLLQTLDGLQTVHRKAEAS